jgi:hypothetical protein
VEAIIKNERRSEMSCCGGSCGCNKDRDLPDVIKKKPRLELRDVAKLCPEFNAAYLASGSFVKRNSKGPDTTYCRACGTQEVLAYLPKCWCGLTIHPGDQYCWYHGHEVCRCENKAECPDWHDYSEMHETV